MPGQIPLIGERFPEIDVVTTKGKLKLPDYFKGKWFILFSHPGDFTPVCTTEFYSFSKRIDEFRKLGVELIGLSVDSNVSHIEWVRWIKEKLGIEVPFPIIADPTGSVAAKLGMIHAESATATVRAVFIVDPNGIVRAILYYPLELGRNIDEILRMVRGLQTIDRSGLVLPANWPNNELIGSKGLVRPPATVGDADEYLKRYEGYAWWFLYSDIPQ
jgi:peroxiredoxin (alkyl hydroperoxide reductase subunit C)